MPFDDDLGEIVTPDIGWAYRPAGPFRGGDAPSVESTNAEPHASNSRRRQRALGLIALSVLIATVAGVHYLTTTVAKPIAAPIVNRNSEAQVTGPIPIPELSQVFTSRIMHYSIKFPTTWIAIPATQVWHGEWETWNKPNVDELNGGSVVFNGTSEPLARGQSPAKWIAKYLAVAGQNRCGVQENMDLIGLHGVIDLNGCSSTDMPGQIYDAAVVFGGRGYGFTMEGAVDHGFFVAMLRTLRFGT